jgi:hypothetical protein
MPDAPANHLCRADGPQHRISAAVSVRLESLMRKPNTPTTLITVILTVRNIGSPLLYPFGFNP